MKTKWFEEVGQKRGDNFISSRIRLARNWEEYAFPNRLNPVQASELIGRMQYGLDDVESVEGNHFVTTTMDKLGDLDRLAFKERRLINSTVAEAKTPMGLMISEKEDVSILLNGDDHLRIQYLAPGMQLKEIWKRADKLDDYISSRFNYAFDEKYGYLTSYPTNVGTGMRANVVVHLPLLNKTNEIKELKNGLEKFGVSIRSVYGNDRDNFGSLYDISNTKTLGMSEKEIVDLVVRTSSQLNDREKQIREAGLERNYIVKQDEVFRAYGILKYARTMRLNNALASLSQVRMGLVDGLIELEDGEECSIYKLMLEVQAGNLMLHSERPLDRRELEAFRADYLRHHLPKIKEA
ncbi:MAG: ATP--guanido phosphotransferase [Lachnospiraceae bacterium]|nr:ATP--guanido phosphotransferase [Lachnospiraceae bacterium]